MNGVTAYTICTVRENDGLSDSIHYLHVTTSTTSLHHSLHSFTLHDHKNKPIEVKQIVFENLSI